MARLTKEQREFIVRSLARFDSYSDILAGLKPATCDMLDIRALDRQCGAIIDPDLSKIYDDERNRILNDPGTAATSDPKVRIRWLHRAAETARGNNQPKLMAELLAQIAQETGGAAAAGGGVGPITAIREIIVDPKPLPSEQMP